MSHRRLLTRALIIGGLSASALIAAPQDPGDGPGPTSGADASDMVARMMKFDKDKDGKLSKAEITDARLVRLWTRADADKNGTVTKSELETLASAESANTGGFGGPGGPGGPGGGPGGPGGPMGSPPKPGEVLPQMMRSRLKLTDEQQTQLDDLQKDVDARMAKILTDSQKTQLKQMSSMRGPGGPPGGGRGGRGGPGGPGGPPPGGPDGPDGGFGAPPR